MVICSNCVLTTISGKWRVWQIEADMEKSVDLALLLDDAGKKGWLVEEHPNRQSILITGCTNYGFCIICLFTDRKRACSWSKPLLFFTEAD